VRSSPESWPTVLFVSRVSPFHERGGMQAVAWDVARALAQSGVPVTFMTTAIPGREAAFEEDGVHVEALAGTKPARYSRSWWRRSRERFQNRWSKTARAVLSVSAGAYSLLSLPRPAPPIRFVMQAHGTALGEVMSTWRTRDPRALVQSAYYLACLTRDLRAYPRFDAIVAVGRPVFRALGRPPVSWSLPGDRLRLIENGVDISLFTPNAVDRAQMREAIGWAPDDVVIVTVSRLHRQKGVDLALRGFAEFGRSQQHARFLVVGGGPQRADLERLAASLGVSDRVRFTGDLPREEVPRYLRAGDAFLFATLAEEGLPLNVLEAAAVGLPMVVPRSLEALASQCGPTRSVNPREARDVARAPDELVGPDRQGHRRTPVTFPELYTLDHCVRQYRDVLLPPEGS